MTREFDSETLKLWFAYHYRFRKWKETATALKRRVRERSVEDDPFDLHAQIQLCMRVGEILWHRYAKVEEQIGTVPESHILERRIRRDKELHRRWMRELGDMEIRTRDYLDYLTYRDPDPIQ
ncbi:MAG: hypothetical protein GX260_00945 [Tissierellia bacterium]|jgi:hypothetical protein|nr:hypothetical protein [Bacillota bacterium]NLL22335.1 hypothetical protein [Tissierellia bacterium]